MPENRGLEIEKQGDIWIYRFYSVTRIAVDEWYQNDMEQTRLAAEGSNHALRAYVIERVVFPSPYLISMAENAVKETPPELYESSALVVKDSTAFRVISGFLTRIFRTRQRTEMRVFKELHNAIAWLEERRSVIANEQRESK